MCVIAFISLQAQSRPAYYAPNHIAQMRPGPRWQQAGRPQGKHLGVIAKRWVDRLRNVLIGQPTDKPNWICFFFFSQQ